MRRIYTKRRLLFDIETQAMASLPDANYETTNCNKTFHRRERESHGVMRRGSLERNHNCGLSMDVACCGGGIGKLEVSAA